MSFLRSSQPRGRRQVLSVEAVEGRVLLSPLYGGRGSTPPAPFVQNHHSQTAGAAQQGSDSGMGHKVASNVIYTTIGGAPQALDVYVPDAAPPAGGWPVILAVHDGGWRKYSKDEYAPHVVPEFTSSGYAVVIPNYSLSSPGRPTWPANIDQLGQALQWINQQAGTYHFDTGKVAAFGSSAGGNLAALLGAGVGESGTARVRAVVDFYGPADLKALRSQSPALFKVADQFLGPKAQSLYTSASPISNVKPGDPPVLIVQGTTDHVVPVVQSIAYAKALSAAGVPNQLILVPGFGHGFYFDVGKGNLAPGVVSFLQRSLN